MGLPRSSSPTSLNRNSTRWSKAGLCVESLGLWARLYGSRRWARGSKCSGSGDTCCQEEARKMKARRVACSRVYVQFNLIQWIYDTIYCKDQPYILRKKRRVLTCSCGHIYRFQWFSRNCANRREDHRWSCGLNLGTQYETPTQSQKNH